MRIFVDADSCPRPARELVLKTARRREIEAVFAANRPIPGIGGAFARMEVCPAGEGAADDFIAASVRPGDLAVTRDIPLAERLVDAGLLVIDDRGKVYTRENIREQRSLRDFMLGLAQNNLVPARTPSYGPCEKKKFACCLDREMTRLAACSTC